MAKKDSGSVAEFPMTTNTDYPVLAQPPDEVRHLVQANLGDGGLRAFDLDRIKIPAGGGLSWTVPTLSGEESVAKLEGIIIHQRNPRAYWATRFEDSGGGSPPDCSSEDGIRGSGNPGGSCERCPLAQWNSDPRGGKGQACKAMKLLFFLRPGNLLPDVISLPPTSIQPIRKFLLRLTSQQLPFWSAVVRLELERAKSGNGIAYSKVKPSVVRKLDAAEAAAVGSFAASIRASLDRVPLEPEMDGFDGQD